MQPNALLWIINLCLFSSRFQHGNTAWPSAINHCNFLLGDFHWGSNNDSTSHGEAFHCLVRQISVNSKSDISSTSQIKKLWCDNWAEKNKNWQRSTLFEWELCQNKILHSPLLINQASLGGWIVPVDAKMLKNYIFGKIDAICNMDVKLLNYSQSSRVFQCCCPRGSCVDPTNKGFHNVANTWNQLDLCRCKELMSDESLITHQPSVITHWSSLITHAINFWNDFDDGTHLPWNTKTWFRHKGGGI